MTELTKSHRSELNRRPLDYKLARISGKTARHREIATRPAFRNPAKIAKTARGTVPEVSRVLRLGLVFALGMTFGACRHAEPEIRLYPKVCPAGWSFLYTERVVIEHALVERAVCERASTGGAA